MENPFELILERLDIIEKAIEKIKLNGKSISLSHHENKKITIDNAIGNQNVIVDCFFI